MSDERAAPKTMQSGPASGRLCSVDVLRGAAALSVAIFHGTHNGVWGNIHRAHDARFFMLLPFSYGGAGVYLFFVISGFCIHLRWARASSAGGVPVNDFRAFWKRRLRRLYPAYAVALAIGVALTVRDGGVRWPDFGWNLGAHVLMLHNLHPATLYGFNAVFWTLAIEEQLYLLYFVFLVLRRRYRWGHILGICFAVRIIWQAFAWAAQRHGIALVVSESVQATWFIWILGALAVEAYYGLVQLPRWTRSLPVACMLAAATAALAYLDRIHDSTGMIHMADLSLEQPGWALASFIVLNALVAREPWISSRRQRIAIAPWLWLGLISYSLYLFHNYVFTGLGWFYVPGVLVAIAVSGVAFALFERPFIGRGSSSA